MLKTIITGLLAALLIVVMFFVYKKQRVQKSEFLVVNVLDKSMYDDCHIADSIHVPFDEIEDFIEELPKDSKVVFYCSNYQCTASGYAARKARELGIKNSWAYEAGMAEWYQKGYPVVGPCTREYLKKSVQMLENQHDDENIELSTEELAQKMQVKRSNES